MSKTEMLATGGVREIKVPRRGKLVGLRFTHPDGRSFVVPRSEVDREGVVKLVHSPDGERVAYVRPSRVGNGVSRSRPCFIVQLDRWYVESEFLPAVAVAVRTVPEVTGDTCKNGDHPMFEANNFTTEEAAGFRWGVRAVWITILAVAVMLALAILAGTSRGDEVRQWVHPVQYRATCPGGQCPAPVAVTAYYRPAAVYPSPSSLAPRVVPSRPEPAQAVVASRATAGRMVYRTTWCRRGRCR